MKQEHKMETLNSFSDVLLEMPSAGLRVFLGDVRCQFDTSLQVYCNILSLKSALRGSSPRFGVCTYVHVR